MVQIPAIRKEMKQNLKSYEINQKKSKKFGCCERGQYIYLKNILSSNAGIIC